MWCDDAVRGAVAAAPPANSSAAISALQPTAQQWQPTALLLRPARCTPARHASTSGRDPTTRAGRSKWCSKHPEGLMSMVYHSHCHEWAPPGCGTPRWGTIRPSATPAARGTQRHVRTPGLGAMGFRRTRQHALPVRSRPQGPQRGQLRALLHAGAALLKHQHSKSIVSEKPGQRSSPSLPAATAHNHQTGIPRNTV